MMTLIMINFGNFQIAPPHSYINVNSFNTVKDLAKHLEHLAVNQTAYNSYFWWQDDYEVVPLYNSHWQSTCDLCQKLNDIIREKLDHVGNQKYQNFNRYWHREICREPNFPK